MKHIDVPKAVEFADLLRAVRDPDERRIKIHTLACTAVTCMLMEFGEAHVRRFIDDMIEVQPEGLKRARTI